MEGGDILQELFSLAPEPTGLSWNDSVLQLAVCYHVQLHWNYTVLSNISTFVFSMFGTEDIQSVEQFLLFFPETFSYLGNNFLLVLGLHFDSCDFSLDCLLYPLCLRV